MNGILFASFVIAANSLVALFADQAEMRRQKHRGNDAIPFPMPRRSRKPSVNHHGGWW
jgi:hypothetical protein